MSACFIKALKNFQSAIVPQSSCFSFPLYFFFFFFLFFFFFFFFCAFILFCCLGKKHYNTIVLQVASFLRSSLYSLASVENYNDSDIVERRVAFFPRLPTFCQSRKALGAVEGKSNAGIFKSGSIFLESSIETKKNLALVTTF